MTEPTKIDAAKAAKPGLVVGGAAAGVVAVLAGVSELLAQHGQILANLAGNLPLTVLVGVLGWFGAVAWRQAQVERAAEAKALADGLTGLRGEVHHLRSDLRIHADQTETRLRAVEAELSTVAGRVTVLESPAKRRPKRPA